MNYVSFNRLFLSTLLTVSAQYGLADSKTRTNTTVVNATLTPSTTTNNNTASAEYSRVAPAGVSHSRTPQDSSHASTLTPLFLIGGGGADTGGGNAMGSERISRYDIKDFILKSKQPSKYILRKFEFINSGVFSGSDYFSRILSKLFNGPKTIFTALDEAVLNPIPNGPCKDKDGNDVDASAKDAPILCFSLERLEARLNRDNAQGEVLALVLHEVSHMVDTTEADADILQFMVKTNLTNSPFRKITSLVESYRKDVNDALDDVEYLISLLKIKPDESNLICSGITNNMTSINKLATKNTDSLSHTEENGIAFSGNSEIWALYIGLQRSVNLMTYCMPDLEAYIKIVDAFKGQKQIPLTEFYNTLYPSNYPWTSSLTKEAVITRQTPGDIESLKTELELIRAVLVQVKERL